MHPYRKFPPDSFWKTTVATKSWNSIFEKLSTKFKIDQDASISSAGSCFAQRVKNSILERKLNYKYFEQPHEFYDFFKGTDFGYRNFSCRYGNIYTTPQLEQLIDECTGRRDVIVSYGKNSKGRFVDLNRPNACPQNFESLEDLVADRIYHLHKVKEMFSDVDVFIFTLGLTEAWKDEKSNIVYGSHPDIFSLQNFSSKVNAVNFTYPEVYTSLLSSINKIRELNSRIKFIFTVSPVGLAATHQTNNVLFASTYSKSVLRSVAGDLAATIDYVDYFPSFEFFSLAQSFGQYLSEDLRDVSGRGVEVIMDCFFNSYYDERSYRGVARHSSSSLNFELNSSNIECDEILNQYLSGEL